MNLTDHFSLEELTFSTHAARAGIKNEPIPSEVAELRRLCLLVLEPLRVALNRPIFVSSGFRCLAVNRLAGGAKNSDHLFGRAADIVVPGMSPIDVCRAIKRYDFQFKQLIHEFGAWTHVSIPLIGMAPEREVLTARKHDGETYYIEGLC
jgi:hypothetical protein